MICVTLFFFLSMYGISAYMKREGNMHIYRQNLTVGLNNEYITENKPIKKINVLKQ